LLLRGAADRQQCEQGGRDDSWGELDGHVQESGRQRRRRSRRRRDTRSTRSRDKIIGRNDFDD
jgi:hypothetical protein